MGKGVLVTGTDTGVGKTLIACGLAYALRDLGYKIGVMKPAESGCEERDGALFPQDAYCLQQAAGHDQSLDDICPYRFSDPLAPSIAAERIGESIDLPFLAQRFREISHAKDLTIVEGAGGILVPLNGRFTYADLAVHLELPLIVVVGNRLGALNHCLLTLEHASRLGLEILGYVLNDLEGRSSAAAQSNRSTLNALTEIPCLGEIPYIGPAKPESPPPVLNRPLLSALFQEKIGLQGVLDLLKTG